MPGKGARLRQHGLAKSAYRLHKRGWAHKEIAEQLLVDSDRVKKLIDLGERLTSFEREEE